MRKLALFDMVSIDGYFEAPGHNIDWHTVDEEFNDFAIQQLDEAGCLVFGRATYELMASYWPTDAAISDDRQVASRMNAIEKVVASRTLDRAEWEHTKVVHDAALDLAGLKAAPGRDMLVLGSARLSADLIDAGLVDEFRLMVSPILLGAGTPPSATGPSHFRSIWSRPERSATGICCSAIKRRARKVAGTA